MLDHDRMEESVAAYALDACDVDERESVRAHIEGCPSCRALAARLTQAVDVLPLATQVVRPPDRLRARILAAAVRPGPRQAREEPPVARRVVPPAREPVAAARVRRPAWTRLRFPVLGGAVAALALALGALAAWNLSLNAQLHQPPARYAMSGTGTMAGAAGTVTAYRTSDVALVSFTGLPQPAPGRVYEMWLIDGAGHATPAGVFTPDPSGAATLPLGRAIHDARVMAVTQESGPTGTAAPTQKPELAGQLG